MQSATDQGTSNWQSFWVSFALSWRKTAAPMRMPHRSTCLGESGRSP